MKNNDRIFLFDNIKFILICMVVVGHFIDMYTVTSDVCRGIFLFIYSFHMPLFLFIAGYFHSYKDTKKKVVYNFSVAFVSKIVIFVFERVLTGGGNYSVFIEGFLPWFMIAIGFYEIVLYLINGINKNYILVLSIIFGCFSGYDSSLGDFLVLSRLIVFFPFYFLGCYIFEKDKDIFLSYALNQENKKVVFSVALIIIFIWAYMCSYRLNDFYVLRHLFTGRNSFSEIVWNYGPLYRLLCYLISILVGGAFILIIPNKKLFVFTKMGTRTLNVYFWHWPIYLLLERIFKISNLYYGEKLYKVIYLSIPVIVTIVLSSKCFCEPLRLIRKAIYEYCK